MERLNKKQRKILDILYKEYPDAIESEIIPRELNCKGRDILADVQLLDQNHFVDTEYEIQNQFPISLTITPDGIEKIRESIFTRLIDSAWKNPWVVITIIVALIAIGSNIYFSNTAENIRVELNEVKEKIAEYDTYIANNTTGDTIYVPCFNGTKPQIKLNDNKTFIICG